MEREDVEPRGHTLDRYDIRGLEPGQADGDDAPDRARPRGVRRRMIALLDGHLRRG
jgi:hypothetical protein